MTVLGFLFADHMPKGTCHEGTISRMRSHGRILNEVSWFETFVAHSIRGKVPPYLAETALGSQEPAQPSWIMVHAMTHLSDPLGDRLSVRRSFEFNYLGVTMQLNQEKKKTEIDPRWLSLWVA